MFKSRYLKFVFVLFLFINALGCKSKEEKAQGKLSDMGIKYDEKSFLYTAKEDKPEAVNLFLEAGISPDTADKLGYTALMHAANRGNTEIVRALIKSGANVNAKTKFQERTPLMFASLYGYTEIVNLLLEAGADVNVKSPDGATALVFSAENGHQDIVNALINAGADLNTKVYGDSTALIWATLKGQTEIVKALIEAGADTNAKNSQGYTALSIAKGTGNKEIAELLIQKGAEEMPPPLSSPTSPPLSY